MQAQPDEFPGIRDRDGNAVECKSKKKPYLSKCLVCLRTVAMHCEDCSIQITACLCTLRARLNVELRQKMNED